MAVGKPGSGLKPGSQEHSKAIAESQREAYADKLLGPNEVRTADGGVLRSFPRRLALSAVEAFGPVPADYSEQARARVAALYAEIDGLIGEGVIGANRKSFEKWLEDNRSPVDAA